MRSDGRADGAIYVADAKDDVIRRVTIEGNVTTFASGFKEPRGIVASGNDFYVTDTKNNAIRRISNGEVSTIVEFPASDGNGNDDGEDGNPHVLHHPTGIALDELGNLIVSDSLNDFIRRIDLRTNTMTVLAGSGRHGWADGDPATAQFKDPVGLTVAGAIYVADEDNDALRRICAEVRVTGITVPVGRLVAGTEVRIFGTGFVPGGTIVTFDGVAATEVAWITSTTVAVKLPQAITGGSVAIAASACGGSTEPVTFVVDNTPPVLTVNPVDGTMAKVPVTPVFSATDEFDPTPVVTATLNGSPFVSGTPVSADGVYTLVVRAEDAAGNAAEQTVHFTIDATAPHVEVFESASPFPSGFWFNRPVVIDVRTEDLTPVTTDVRIDGETYVPNRPYAIEKIDHQLVVRATDALGNETVIGPLSFTIDRTPPALAFTSHANGQTVTVREITLTGAANDSVTVKVNGRDATVDAKTFTIALPLSEGENSIVATGVDRAGNSGSASLTLTLDTRAPALTIDDIAGCTRAESLDVHGTVSDAALGDVVVKLGDATTRAAISGTSWSATVPLGAEGRKALVVDASDASGHVATQSATLVVDRTAPAIALTESGTPFDATIVSRPVAFFFRASDEDPATTATATLDGVAYVAGTEVRDERSHTIRVTARDCAGNEGAREQTFVIDLTPPRFLSFQPATGSKVAQVPATLSGTVDADAVEVRLADGSVRVPVQNGAFTLDAHFAEGVNERSLEVVDRAGHIGRTTYTLGIRTTEPLVDIVEGGVSLADGVVYSRVVRPEVRVFEEGVKFTATLDGAPFTNGTEVAAGGAHTISATATDAAYGTSRTITRAFTIDRTGPAVTIVAPQDGTTIDAATTEVRVTATDAVRVTINGIAAVQQQDAWLASVPLDAGENTIVANARDAVGNSGSATVSVTRGNAAPALVLTFPPDPYLTNRPRIDVSGRVLRAGSSVTVTVPPAQASNVAVDPAGAFRVTGAELTEGETTIVATATESGKSVSVSARVIADFTPPKVRLLESGQPFAEGANFASQAVLSAEATDKGQGVDYVLRIDGVEASAPATITANGGHTAVITARDAAGNEARLERTFFIGATAGGGCSLSAFDPADGATITANQVELIGRSGGAAGVKVNGIAAKMAAGSFCATVELPQEGANRVTIVCTDANGNATGAPETITLVRVTDAPSVTITTPAEGYATHDATLVITGTLGNGAVSVDLNGKAATINGSNWTVPDVHLSDGINVLVARAKNAAGKVATASRRVTFTEDAPAIVISTPLAGFVSGAATTNVSGTYSNVDPSSLAIAGLAGAIDATPWSDTTGQFVAHDVPLTSGANTIAVTGRSITGRTARAEVAIRYDANAPRITIVQPADNHYFAASAGNEFIVSGTFSVEGGASVDVNGVVATVDQTAKTFTAQVPFSTLPGGITPVVARVAQAGGDAGGFDSLRVFKLSAAPKALETFPAANAIEVDPGVVVLVLFSSPMDMASTKDAFRLENGNGTAVNGTLYLDKDVLTFAPAAALAPGERYTIKVATTARDLAGQALESAIESSFFVASTAPSSAPQLTTASGRICAPFVDVAGTTTAGARVRLDYGTIFFTTTASATGAFSYKVPLSGQQGFHVIRVRTIGADGTLSPFAELKLNVDCTGPQVVSASYDRNVNTLTILFSREIKPETLAANIELVDGVRSIGGTAVANGASVVFTPAEDLTQKTFTLKIATGIEDTQGRKLEFPYTQLFSLGDDEPQTGNGGGSISGEVYDATTGRPLANAEIAIGAIVMTTDARGRYTALVPEGAHTIAASANGYTRVWRQIVVPAGAGVIPIDIRLTRRGETKTAGSGALTLSHGIASFAIPAGALASGTSVTLTAVGGQSLAGLLPLGWSPIASAEIIGATSGRLTFDVPQSQITAAAQTLTAVRYDESRDEWQVIAPVVGGASFDIDAPGAYALVYPDKRPGLATPPQPHVNAALQGVPDPCAAGTCPPMVAKSFPLNPEVVLPTGSTVATLNIDGADPHVFPSGTAVQAYIDEELRLADGGRELDPPFATDLLLYRSLDGDEASATFNLAPSARAAEVLLEVGFDHIRVLPYPGRLDRGTLIGPEGGRVPGDDQVSVEIPSGAAQDALRATATSISDLGSLGTVAGFTIVGALQLTLERATQTTPVDIDGDGDVDPIDAVELTAPARATFTVTTNATQLILAELIDQTPYGHRILRLASEMTPAGEGRWTTKTIDRQRLPVDGILHEGRYVLLAANAPIAFAKGIVRLGTGVAAGDARVITPALGVADLSRLTGVFALPVPAAPASPFALVPRTVALGDGTTYTHASAPAAEDVVDVGSLIVVAQPPHVTATLPAANATNVALSTSVEVSFAPGIDPASINATSLLVFDTTANASVTGTVAAIGSNGIRWTLPPGETLQPSHAYAATVAPSVRGSNGAPLGQSYTFAFATVAVVTNAEVHPERIRITIPDGNGVSKIIGAPGALVAGWVATPQRRGNDFLTKYSVVAGADGSFSLTIGTTERDRVTLAEAIDLRVLNTNGALVAIVPLTPFVSEDNRAFIAPARTAVTFVSADGIAVNVPANAFDAATRVDVIPAPLSAFSAVPHIDTELKLGAAVELQFAGRANAPLELSLPLPAGSDPSVAFFLALLGDSLRGPRLMAVDTLSVVDGRLTTVPPSSSGARTVRTNASDVSVRDRLQRVIEAGRYAAAQMNPDHGTLAWAFMDTAANVYELVWDTLASMFVSHEYVAGSGGRIAFPVPQGTRFTVTGYDPATSLRAFTQTYDAIPIGGSGTIQPPQNDLNGPYPVYATPFRVESADAPPVGVTLLAVRGIEMTLDANAQLTVTGTGPATVLDIDSGERRGPLPLPLQVPNTKTGDRIVVILDEEKVDPSTSVSIVFNEPIAIPPNLSADQISAFLKSVFRFEQAGSGLDLLGRAYLRADSGNRRVSIVLPSALEAGAKFRLTIDPALRDTSGNGLAPGQAGKKSDNGVTPIGSDPAPIDLFFSTREPAGTFAQFDIRQSATAQFGAIRETAQYGNLLFVAASDGGVLAYDVSDPAALNADAPAPLAVAPGRDSATSDPVTDYWTVHVDHHGRVFSTGVASLFCALRSWRVEDFINAKADPTDCLPTLDNMVCRQTGGMIVSQAPGTAYGVGLPSETVVMDRVEAIPRKVKYLIGDLPSETLSAKEFVTKYCNDTSSDAGNGLRKCTPNIVFSGSKYRIQRITVENPNLGLRWSEDAIDGGYAPLGEVLFAPGDSLTLTRNVATYAVINLFGWGLGLFDVNAMESNEVPGDPPVPAEKAKEQIELRAYADDPSLPDDIQKVGDLAFSPDCEILATSTGSVRLYALDTRKGVVEFSSAPPAPMDLFGKIILTGGVHPRWEQLAAAIRNATGTTPVARFSTASRYTNPETSKNYLLVTAMDFGVIALEVGGVPLNANSFADAIYIPGGARAVRVIEHSNMAVVANGEGYVYLVDLSRIDERAAGPDLFPTVATALATNTQDPRILWKSDAPIAIGNIGPLVDPDTGMLIGADLLTQRVRIGSAIDPKLRVVVNNGSAMQEVRTVVPLGIDSVEPLAVFRVEASLPGSMTESLENGLSIAIESEVVPGVEAVQTPEPYPVAHLRRKNRSGAPAARATNDFRMHRVLTDPKLRYQKGWNRLASDWVVAIADPRAAKTWGSAPECPACARPAFIDTLGTVRELYTRGRFLAIRPEIDASSVYGFLGDRLTTRITTIAADTVRPLEALVAGQSAPVAEGMLQETTYMHSGEVETSTVDYDAGGRAGWNVAFDRTYRSRTLGLTPLGSGWDSALFRRLRALPNGDVEYRDGAEVWRFTREGGGYKAPEGLFLTLVKRDGGWNLQDQQLRITRFDDYGRLVAESDEFFTPRDKTSGNTISYIYDDQGRLAYVVDPLGRASKLTYGADGLLAQITDWHQQSPRSIDYQYSDGRLAVVKLPNVPNVDGTRPQIAYTYTGGGSGYRQQLEAVTNLETITDAGMSQARVDFDYDGNDRVSGQKWVTGETARFDFAGLPSSSSVTDILGQQRAYTLTGANVADPAVDRAHTSQIVDQVEVWTGAPFGEVPQGPLTPGAPNRPLATRTRKFTYEHGMMKSSELVGVGTTTNTIAAATGAPGYVVKSSVTAPAAGSSSGPSWMPQPGLIERTFNYQAEGGVFLDSMAAGAKLIQSREPHRELTEPASTNSAIETKETYDSNGRLKAVNAKGGTDTQSAGAAQTIEYYADDEPLYKRGLPRVVTDGALATKYDYTETQTIVTDPRGVVTTTTFDTWNRPIEVKVEKEDEPALRTKYAYEASGRVHSVTTERTGGDVTTTYDYDLLGRQRSVTTDQIATVGTQTTETTYLLGAHLIKTRHPGGAITTTELDALGRVVRAKTETGSSPIEQQYAYDIAGNRVYTSDMLTAAATAYDAHGRAIASKAPDGTISTTEYDDWSRAKNIKTLTKDAAQTVAESSFEYTDAGRLLSSKTNIDSGVALESSFLWDGGGRTTGMSTGGRASHSKFDVSGRLQEVLAGGGNAAAVSEIFSKTTISAFDGNLPAAVKSAEKDGAEVTSSATHDAAGNVKQQTVGPLTWEQEFDPLGNVTKAKVPGRPETKFDVDARGAVKTETLPDGATNTFEYDASGAQKSYTDPENEPTSTTTDLLGRPIRRTYADLTAEEIVWEGTRVRSVTDRQGRKLIYGYNAGGQLETIADGDGHTIDLLTYDSAGRLVSWKNADSEIVWSEFNLQGQPKKTIQRRFANGSGFATSPTLIDAFEQSYTYNEHGERTDFSMPAYDGFTFGAGWTPAVHQNYDAMGNIVSVGSRMTASYRNAGRPDSRSVTTSAGAVIVRSYGYDSASSQMNRMSVEANGIVVAGSDVAYDGLQLSSARLLGVSSNARFMQWRYDDRSRLLSSVAGASATTDPLAAVPGRAKETLNRADFRSAQERAPQFDETTSAALAERRVDTAHLDPPSTTFDEQTGGGHKIAKVTKGPKVYPFAWNGAERLSDGRFEYQFDAKGRLVTATEVGPAVPKRRLVYFYSGTGRVVGRRAEYLVDDAWKLEDRPPVIAADGLPADTTFVWDPISDNLLEVFKAGATTADPQGGLLKQVIHGGASYDDPIETAALDPAAGKVIHLYPIYDEAGAGSLQIVLNDEGQVVARMLPNDAYGAEDVDFTGAAIDGATVKVTKDSAGAVEQVEVTLHATEQLLASTAATGARLAALDESDDVLRTTTATASVAGDPFTLHWTLSADQWSTLTSGAASLSVAATNTLRAAAWSLDTPILPAPEWATATKGTVYTSATLPVELREPLSSLTTFIASIPPGTSRTTPIYEIPNLTLASPGGTAEPIETILAARMHAHPFTDPATGLNYVRNRWYDPTTGTFLSPDPLGYRDSSNLYAFAGGDPVNGRDPTGQLCERANAENLWDWTKRCAQDIGWVAAETNEGITAPKNIGKNLKRAAGGVKSTAKLVGGAVRTIAWDLPTASVNDAAADRLVAAGHSIGNFVSHPIDTTIRAHEQMAANVLSHEQRGEYVASGEAAASQAQTDFLIAYSAYSFGSGTISRLTPSVTLEPGAYTASWFADNALLSSESVATGSVAADTLLFRGSFYEVLSEQSISGTTRAAHRGSANRAFLSQIESDESFAAGVNEQFGGIDVADFMRSGKGGLRNPPGTQWHHPFDNPSVMRLLRGAVHSEPTLQDVLHPDGSGGFANFYGN